MSAEEGAAWQVEAQWQEQKAARLSQALGNVIAVFDRVHKIHPPPLSLWTAVQQARELVEP